jgi:hypothetical protein
MQVYGASGSPDGVETELQERQALGEAECHLGRDNPEITTDQRPRKKS